MFGRASIIILFMKPYALSELFFKFKKSHFIGVVTNYAYANGKYGGK
jgi:hypothetical protein